MKSLRDRKSNSSVNPRNGLTNKSSVGCPGNNSIISLFERQQKKWDALFSPKSKSNLSKETTQWTCPVTTLEASTNINETGDDDANKRDSVASVGNCVEGILSDNADCLHQSLSRMHSDDSVEGVSRVSRNTLENNLENQNDDKNSTAVIKTDSISIKEQNQPEENLYKSINLNQINERKNKLSLKRKRSSSLEASTNISENSTLSGTPVSISSDEHVTFEVDLSDSVPDSISASVSLPLPSSVSCSDLNEEEAQATSVTEPKLNDYYLDNFLLILNVITSDKYYIDLFNWEDMATIDLFRQSLEKNAQRLYVRLFLRKHKWLRKGKISYPLISEDLTCLLDHLVICGLLLDDTSMTLLEDAVWCLPAPDLKTIAKSLHLQSSSKMTLSNTVIRHAQRCDSTNFFSQSAGSTEKMIMKRAKNLLGRCYKLTDEKRSVFLRVMMLFGLHNTIADDEAYGQQLIFQMLATQIGRIKYPEYNVSRKTRIFDNRESVMRYAEALQMESDLCQSLEKKDYELCLKLYLKAKEVAELHLKNPDIVNADTSLPVHLRSFTAGAIYIRLMTFGVEVLQFLKNYKDAVIQLQQLLGQDIYHRGYRGRWYDRLALNLDFHLKQPVQALEVIKTALSDDCVRTGHRYNLLQRAKKICSSSAMKKSASWWTNFQDDPMNEIQEAPTVTFAGRQLSRDVPGGNPLWITSHSSHPNDEEATVISRVEEVALRHYADNGYPEGLHREGSTFFCLFVLFMWDILFVNDIDDVFYNQYQTYPLDIFSDSFYSSRQTVISDKLTQISTSSDQELYDLLSETWNNFKDTLCFGMDWQLFRDLSHAGGLVKCIGGNILAGIFERMVRLLRSVTGGVPDLVVWNPETGKFKIVEVKGPGDRLSSKQILWLDYLLRLGVDAEVCHIRAVGSRTISRTR